MNPDPSPSAARLTGEGAAGSGVVLHVGGKRLQSATQPSADVKNDSRPLFLTLALWAVGLLASAAVAFWWRRLAGALETPFSWPMLLAAGALMAATAVTARVA